MREVGPRDAFDDVQLLGVNRPVRHLFVETDGVDHQRVALPLACRMSLPRGIPDLRMRTSVDKDLAEARRRLFTDVNQLGRRLYKLEDVTKVGLRSWQTDARALKDRARGLKLF